MSPRGGPSRLMLRIILDQQERRIPNYVSVNSFCVISYSVLFCRCKKHKGGSLLGGTFGIARQVMHTACVPF